MTPESAIAFLEEMARYFSKKSSKSKEDSEFWSNNYNASNCKKIANLLRDLNDHDSRKMISMGVGDGSGKLFVYGDYESIKTVLEKMKQ